jgi:SpoVK/Ycf46/Vps4 family AAA+-type ATPase
MQDHRHPIFIIATANDVSALPPELMRKGRFDEIFFIDLPKAKAREHILRIHIQRRKRDPKLKFPPLI